MEGGTWWSRAKGGGGLFRLLAGHREGPEDGHRPAEGKDGREPGGKLGPKAVWRAGLRNLGVLPNKMLVL